MAQQSCSSTPGRRRHDRGHTSTSDSPRCTICLDASNGTANLGAPPPSSAGGFNQAASIFATSDGARYWVVIARGGVYNFGDAPSDGDMAGTHLNGTIIAAPGS